jgi:hypothetical protein
MKATDRAGLDAGERAMTARWSRTVVAVVLLGAALPLTVTAQDGGVTLELGAARAFPPSGTDARQASYGLLGVRAERWTPAGSGVWGAAYGARALDAGASNWGSANVGGQIWLGLLGRLDLGVGASGYGFTVSEPFSHRAVTGQVTPGARVRLGRALLLVKGVAGWGRSIIEVRQTDVERLDRHGIDRVAPESDQVRIRRAENELWLRGVEPEFRVLVGRGIASLSAGVFESPRGTYRKVAATVAGSLGLGLGVAWTASAAAWDTPIGRELSGGVMVSVPFGGSWSARATGVRAEPSPLILTRGASQGGVTLSRHFWSAGRGSGATSPVARVDGAGTVDFKITLAGADRVDVLGDFTSWEAVPMRRDGDDWTATVSVAPGVYHFGFLVDGEWFLPDDGIEGRVSDEWGRENGTLFVPEGT